jgi:hypothetical protein
MAPYLNGELFKRIHGIDDQGYWIPDEQIERFFDFLFQYNFTVEENELYDEELELNPEFLGIIFERLTNKEQGAVYTPRVEVDLMCRLALVHWLEKTTQFEREDLYHFLFREAGTGEAYDECQKQGDFSAVEICQLVEMLSRVTMCDPAAGSGAFEVGMPQVLDGMLKNLLDSIKDLEKRFKELYLVRKIDHALPGIPPPLLLAFKEKTSSFSLSSDTLQEKLVEKLEDFVRLFYADLAERIDFSNIDFLLFWKKNLCYYE